jgi:signal transduction histidine kinase
MPRSLARRIALAFIGLSLATWIAVGGALFLILRGLHADEASARLADVAIPLVAQVRAAVAGGTDLPAVLATLRDRTEGSDYGVYLQLADGRIVGLGGESATLEGLEIDPAAPRGGVDRGTFRSSDGASSAWVASFLRNPGARGPRAVVLTTPDRSGAEAFRDVLATLPVVVLVTLMVGVPIAWLLSRSVTEPLRRLAAATSDLPNAPDGPLAPLPLEGPTEVRDLTIRFESMRAELVESRRRETELLADLRHDLRTPLTVIAGFSAALTDGTATGDDATRAAAAIAQEADRIDDLVDQLGEIERLREGEAGLRPEPLDAGLALVAAAARFGPAARACGIELSVIAGSGEAGTILMADRLAVERILANLIANALDALDAPDAGETSAGHVWLGLGPAVRAGDAASSVVLSVTDDGPGFPPGTADRVFDRFYRADPARSGTGSGLGLSIVRDLVLAHGGSVHAENVAPRGARVSVVLPVVPPVVARAAPRT